ncbi:MAG: NADH-quinone oxidoreductase subunit H, partial [Verrucomicrobiales bacterium]|nr:NADH-quinone oxidoreductase subunit H [Verrucomicrobiales bacterium]
IGSGLIVTMFFGGWSIPFGDHLGLTSAAAENNVWIGLLHIFSFLTKVVLFVLFFIWVRWTLPRFRYDQLMKLGWVFFFEIALVNVLLTAAILMWVK